MSAKKRSKSTLEKMTEPVADAASSAVKTVKRSARGVGKGLAAVGETIAEGAEVVRDAGARAVRGITGESSKGGPKRGAKKSTRAKAKASSAKASSGSGSGAASATKTRPKAKAKKSSASASKSESGSSSSSGSGTRAKAATAARKSTTGGGSAKSGKSGSSSRKSR